jgi:hypothetical protein
MLLLTALTLTLAAPQALAEHERTSLIAGRVVDASTGRPIAAAIITPAGSAVVLPPTTTVTPRVMTNANGQFVIRGLHKGAVVLTATKGGYVNATYGQRRPGGTAQPLPIESDTRVTDLELRMWKFGAIGGTIVDESGDPVVGTRVASFSRTWIAGRRRYTAGPTGVTDDRGVYRIAGLTPGEYVIAVPSTQTAVPSEVMDSFFGGVPLSDAKRTEASRELNLMGSAIAPSGSQFAIDVAGQTMTLPPGTLAPAVTRSGVLVYPTLFYPAAASAAQATTVAIRSGEERSNVDLLVRPARGVRVSGTLIGPEGPAEMTGIRLVPVGSDDLIDQLDTATAVTNAAGQFTFPAVPAGQYVLRVLRLPRPPIDTDASTRISVTPGGSMTISSAPSANAAPSPPPIPKDATLIAQLPVAVGDRDVTDMIVTLGAAPRVSGRVEFDGTIERPTTESLTGLRITLDPADGSKLPNPTLAFQTGRPDEKGEFTTYGVPPGRYVIRVSPIPAGWFFKGAMLQGRDVADTPLELESKDVSGIVITFTDRPSSIAGTVRGAEGPDPTAIVLAYPVDSDVWSSSGALSRRMRTARAAKDGTYSLTALAPGEYYVVAIQEDLVGEWQDPTLLQALIRVARQIRVVEGERKTQDFTAAQIR